MVTLIAVLSLVFFTGEFTGVEGSLVRLLLPILSCAVLPWTAWLDLSGFAESGARTPFISAVIYSIAAPVFYGTMADSMSVVMALGVGEPGAIRFLAEFFVMLYAPLSLMLAPCIRITVLGGQYGVRGVRPSMALVDLTAIRLYQALGVLMIGVMCFALVLNNAFAGIETFSELHLTENEGVFTWRQTVPIMVPLYWVGAVFSMFALAWGQFGHGLPTQQRIEN